MSCTKVRFSAGEEPGYEATMQHIWFVYTVHQTLPFCCRGGSGSQDYSGTSLLKTTILVLSSEVSLLQGEMNLCCPD